MSLPFVLAGSDPLAHVLDHSFLPLGITVHVFWMLIATVLCILVCRTVAARMEGGETGGRLAGFFEVILLYIRDEVVRPFLGKEGDKFLPIIWTLFWFILFMNLLGLVPIPGNSTATGNIAVTGALATFALVFYHSIGIKKNGLIHYTKANLLVGPSYLWPMMIPIEIFGHIIKPCALAIRLFANMVAGHVMLAVFMGFCGIFGLGSAYEIFFGGAIADVYARMGDPLNVPA